MKASGEGVSRHPASRDDALGYTVFACLLVFMLLCAAVLGAGYAGKITDQNWKRETVKRGFAEYNQTTGAWQWKPEVRLEDE